MNYQVKEMLPIDWEQVKNIYLQGINTGRATFQMEVPTWESWDQNHMKVCRFVAMLKNTILGWVAISPTSTRNAYCGVVEVSIYVDESFSGQGIGRSLLEKLIEVSGDFGFWTLQSIIIKENIASIALHRKCGFREVGFREKISQINGVWHDTVLMEHRSKKF